MMVEKQPFFSIIIPTYNCADLLRRALESIKSQIFKDFEVLIIDNSSTDHTREVISSFDNLKIKILKINNFGVIAASRNIGIKAAQGEWVAFLDSDDVWYPTKLELVKEVINNNPKIILVCHNERLVTQGVLGKVLKYGPMVDNMYSHLLFNGNALSTSAVTVKREILLQTRGFSESPEFVTVEDYEYWMRLSQRGTFFFMDEALGEYHIHGQNESTKIERHVQALIAVVMYHLARLDHSEYSERKIKKRRAEVWHTGARLLLKEGLFQEATDYCVTGSRIYPWVIKGYIVLLLSKLRLRF